MSHKAGKGCAFDWTMYVRECARGQVDDCESVEIAQKWK